MCDPENFPTILHGLCNGTRFFGLLLTLLTMRACNFQVAGHDSSAIHGITDRYHGLRGSLEIAAEGAGFFHGDDTLMGRSGDPWASHNQSGDVKNSRSRSRFSANVGQPRNCTRGQNSAGRHRRSVIHLYNMVVCATGCDPTSYKGYGCYCGFLGSGSAVDGIDRCCRMHDRCYEATECPGFLEYFVPYYWKCYRGYRPICAIEHGKWGGSGSCAQRLCECDRALSECLRRFPCPTSKAVCTTSPWRLIQNVFMIF